MYRNRRGYQIALVFIWSLAYGVWIGASWHAAAENSLVSDSPVKVARCCQACVSDLKSQSGPAQITNDAAKPTTCFACQLSTVLPELPRIQFLVELPKLTGFDAPVVSARSQISSQFEALPPGRGPPQA